MSKQYLTIHTVENAHRSTIFAVATTPDSVFSASGGASIKVLSATAPNDASLTSEIPNAHKTGIHHLATARGGPGKVLVSAGFGGDVKVWVQQSGGANEWKEHCTVNPWAAAGGGGGTRNNVWAVALSDNEQFLACSAEGGRVAVWDIVENRAVHLYETASSSSADAQHGTLGMSVDISADGRLTACGLQNGTVYVFNNDSGRLVHSLNGLSKPIRAVKFSPGGTRLATAGDAGIIALYDTKNGEQVANLSPGPSGAWVTALDWSHTGEFLLSGASDGRSRVWSVESGNCVATHSEGAGTLWAVRWLPKRTSHSSSGGEIFCVAGESANLSFYREATGVAGP